MLKFIERSEAPHNMVLSSRRDKIAVPLFVILTYVVSWTLCFFTTHFAHVRLYVLVVGHRAQIMVPTLLIYLGGVVPGLVALAVSFGLGGRGELISLLKTLNPLTPQRRCYVLAVLLPLVVLLAGSLLNSLDAGTSFGTPAMWPWVKWLFTSITVVSLWEELGWRGFLLPRLQAKRTGFHASMVIAPVWGVWHFPIKYLSHPTEARGISFVSFFCVFLLSVCGLSIILTWLYNISRATIVPGIILHGVFNALVVLLVDAPATRDGIKPFVWSSISICLAATLLLFLDGENLGRSTLSSPSSDENQSLE